MSFSCGSSASRTLTSSMAMIFIFGIAKKYSLGAENDNLLVDDRDQSCQIAMFLRVSYRNPVPTDEGILFRFL